MIPLKDNIPTRKPALVTYVIIALNIAVFIFFQQALFGKYGGFSSAGNPERVVHFTFIPYRLSHPGSACGLKAEVEGQILNSPNGQPLCSGEVETFTDTATGAPVRARIGRVIDHNEPSVWLTSSRSASLRVSVTMSAGAPSGTLEAIKPQMSK